MAKKTKPKISLSIEMGEDGLITEKLKRSEGLTDDEEKKFWECVNNNKDGGFLDRETMLKVFNEVFRF